MTGVLRNLDTGKYTERDHYVKIKAELGWDIKSQVMSKIPAKEQS